jgi:hypothetical protein
MALEAATLVLMSAFHLGGILDDGSSPFDPTHAGIAESIIAAVLAGGTLAWLRGGRLARLLAAASVGFAIVGFAVGLNFTIRGGAAVGLTYHVVVLPLLLLTLVPVIRSQSYRRSEMACPGPQLQPRDVSRLPSRRRNAEF